MLLGGPVGSRQGEGGVLRRAEEARVDDVTHPGRRGGVDEGPVLSEPVGGLGSGDHEKDIDARQSGGGGPAVPVAGDGDVIGPMGRAGGIAHEQAGTNAVAMEEAGDCSPDPAGGTGDGDGGGGARSGHGPCIHDSARQG